MKTLILKKSQLNSIVCFLSDFYIDISAHNSNKYYKKSKSELDKLICKLNLQANNSQLKISSSDCELISKYLTFFYNECTLKNSIHVFDNEQMIEFNRLTKLFI